MMKVRLAELRDINSIVEVHLERFSGFFLSNLGKDFLHIFYTGFLHNPGILLVIEDNGEIKGFAAGSRNNRGFYKKLLLNNIMGFIISGLKILVLNPKALLRIASNTRMAEKNDLIFGELLSIATLRNKNAYGRILLSEFENEFAKNNYENLPLTLTTDYHNNIRVIDFYRENGYEVYQVFESYENRKMYRFIKHIDKK